MATARRLQDVVDDYLKDLALHGRSANHVLHYRILLTDFVKAMGNTWPSEISPEKMRVFFYGGRIGTARWPGLKKRRNGKGQDVAGSTWNLRRNLMAKFVRDVAAMPKSGLNPEVMAQVKKRKVVQRKWIWLTDDQLARAIDALADLRDQAMLAFMAEYWPRAGEIRNMRISDVNLDAAVVHYVVTKSSTTDERHVYWHLTPDCDQRIRRWLAAYAAAAKLTLPALLAKGDEWYLFPSRTDTGDRWDATRKRLVGRRRGYRPSRRCAHPWDVVKAALLAIGFTPEQVKFHGGHAIRRSGARLLYDANGQRIGEVQAGLGHASELTTRIYLGLEQNVVDRNDGLKAGGWRARVKPDAAILPLHGATERQAAHGQA